MKKIYITIILALLCTSCSKKAVEVEHLSQVNHDNISMIIATDLHYFDPSLFEAGDFFDSVLAKGDGKVLQYSDQLLEAFIQEVLAIQPDFLIITGDLTLNGEAKSHQTLADNLARLEEKGIKVYVIPGNHDINNPRSRGYNETTAYSVDNISTNDFASIYQDFGYAPGESIREPNTLNYLVKLSDDHWLFMLDTNNNTKPKYSASDISGSITPETQEWMKAQIATNDTHNPNIMVGMHHNLYRHSDMINEGFTIDKHTSFKDFLNQINVSAVFSGHIHIQSIVNEGPTDFVTNALSVSPNQYAMVKLNKDTLDYETKKLEFTMIDQTSFQATAEAYFLEVANNMVLNRINDAPYTLAEKQAVATLFSELNQYYFAGEIVNDVNHYRTLEAYTIIQESDFFTDYLEAILENPTDSNQLSIPLKP